MSSVSACIKVCRNAYCSCTISFSSLYTIITTHLSIMPSKDKYTDPKLRDEVKEELHNSDKGGAPGQWSARKAQMMASEYVLVDHGNASY